MDEAECTLENLGELCDEPVADACVRVPAGSFTFRLCMPLDSLSDEGVDVLLHLQGLLPWWDPATLGQAILLHWEAPAASSAHERGPD